MNSKENLISLLPYTSERCHEFYRKYDSDPLMTKVTYIYDEKKVGEYYCNKVTNVKRRFFAIVFNGNTIGEIQIKNIDFGKRTGTLSIILANNSVKNQGYGTSAEKLILDYAFNKLGLQTVFADAVRGNARSKHVLEKVGFVHTHNDDVMSYYKFEK